MEDSISLTREEIDRTAEEIHDLCVSRSLRGTFMEGPNTCKAFYRRIARWHLLKSRKILLEQK